jgi:hypothetical protein
VSLTILNVAYPLAPVGQDAIGGAEQVLTQLDRALTEAGHRSIVVAREGSRVAGTLVALPAEDGVFDAAAKQRAEMRHREAIISALQRWPVDLVHLHGIDFDRYLPPAGVPALVTLHLPPSWYQQGALAPARPETWLHCVSHAQHAACPRTPHLLRPIPERRSGRSVRGTSRKARLCPLSWADLSRERRAPGDRGRQTRRCSAPACG